MFQFFFAQKLPDKNQLSALSTLKTKYNKNISVYWNKSTASPEIITFSRPVAFDESQTKSSMKFLQEIKEILNYRTQKDTFVIVRQKERKNKKYIRYQQEYNGIPVKGGEYNIAVLENGEIKTALGSFYQDISIDTNPQISYKEAVQFVLKTETKLGELKDSLYSYKLFIYPYKENYYLAYKLHIPCIKNAESRYYIVDAIDG